MEQTNLMHMPNNEKTLVASSYILMGVFVAGVFFLHLVPALFAGMLVFVVVRSTTPFLPKQFSGRKANLLATVLLAVMVIGTAATGVAWLVSALHGNSDGLGALWAKIAQTIEGANAILPQGVVDEMPTSADDVKTGVVHWLRDHSPELRVFGKESGIVFAHVLVGMIIGAMCAVHEITATDGEHKPLTGAMLTRIGRFSTAFHNVAFAQGKIAFINASLTGVYLLGVMPVFGIHLPFAKTMILVTAVVGLLPVVGNLISNSIVVVVSASVSFSAAIASLAFLIVLHKAEYFLNAKIIGNRINAKAFELLLGMLVMEAAFGLPGVVAAPILYAYVKSELSEAGLV